MKFQLKKFNEYYTKAAGLYNRIFLLLILVVVALAIISLINPPYSNNNNEDVKKSVNNLLEENKFIPCTQTPDSKLEDETNPTFSVVTQISLINFSNEVLSGNSLQTIIPPINLPNFVKQTELATCLTDDRTVVVVTIDGISKVYPQAILENHIVVNDTIGDTKIIIVHTPISGLFRVYKSEIKGTTYIFGHSGMLYKNTDLLIDYKTNTLWSAITGKALVGTQAGATLEAIDFRIMSFEKSKTTLPNAEILSFVTGHRRYYGVDQFITFKSSATLYQKPEYTSAQLENKEYVLGFEIKGSHYAVPLTKITKDTTYTTILNDKEVKFENIKGEYIVHYGDEIIKYDRAFWYIWYDYNPDTKVI
jgi:hypothetical protein